MEGAATAAGGARERLVLPAASGGSKTVKGREKRRENRVSVFVSQGVISA